MLSGGGEADATAPIGRAAGQPWFDWDRNHRRPLARHLPQYYCRRLGTGISATPTTSAIAIELLKASS